MGFPQVFDPVEAKPAQEFSRRRKPQSPIRPGEFLHQFQLPEDGNEMALISVTENLVDFPLTDRLLERDAGQQLHRNPLLLNRLWQFCCRFGDESGRCRGFIKLEGAEDMA